MNVRIKSIDDPVTTLVRDNLHQSRFLVEFETGTCTGRTHLFVLHSSPTVNIDSVRQFVLGQQLQVAVSVRKICDFTLVNGAGHEQMVSLGRVGAFALEGRIIKQLITGEGSFFQGRDVSFLITPAICPECLDVDEGSWVRFNTEGLTLWITGDLRIQLSVR